jgi:general secretion pathway protein I
VVTHVVSLGPGSDRNGGAAAAAAASKGIQPPETSNQWVNPATGQIVPNPIPGPNGQMLDPVTRQPLVNRQQHLDQLNSGQAPTTGGGIFNPRGKVNQ